MRSLSVRPGRASASTGAGRLVQAALEHAGDSIPTAAGNLAASDAAYRFLNNPNVDPHDIDDAHARSTVDRLAALPRRPADCSGYHRPRLHQPRTQRSSGQLAHAKHFGFFVHSALAATADGLPLGLLSPARLACVPPTNAANARNADAKKRPTRNRNAGSTPSAACIAALPADRPVVMIADRECDFYDYFAVAASARPGRADPARSCVAASPGPRNCWARRCEQEPCRVRLTVQAPRAGGPTGATGDAGGALRPLSPCNRPAPIRVARNWRRCRCGRCGWRNRIHPSESNPCSGCC